MKNLHVWTQLRISNPDEIYGGQNSKQLIVFNRGMLSSKFWEDKSICSTKYIFPDSGKPNLQISESSGNIAEEISLRACPALLFFSLWILVVRYWASIQGWTALPSHCPAKSTFSWQFCNWIQHHISFLLAYLEETWLHSFRETCACLRKSKRKALF